MSKEKADPQAPATALVKSPPPQVLDPAYLQARDLYFAHSTLADISRATGLSTKTLKKWKKEEDWDLTREDEDRGLIENSFGARKVTIAKIIKTAPEVLLRGLAHIANRADPATLDEQVKISAIIANLAKISQLDNGKATDNVNMQMIGKISMTAADVRKVLTEDPFFTFEAPPEKE